MPVQFVCPHCTQLLSVGSRKIGTPVTCPRCRRDVVVPDEEAAAVSVAMRQAQKAPPESPLPEFMVYDEPQSVQVDSPPIIVTDAPLARRPEPPRHEPRPPKSETAPWWQKHTGEREPMLLVSRRVLFLQAGILAATTLAAFGLGYLVGHGVAPPQVAGPAPQAGEGTLVQGYVRYTTAAGEVRGDAGSVVIALPDGRLPTPKLGVQGLRPGDAAPVPGGGVLMSLELLGGAMTHVADDGSYTLAVPEPGRYFLLFVSRHTQRTAGSQPDEFQLALMQRYFQPADELIGTQKYLWRVEALAAGSTSRSHDFGVSGAD
jgi:hypothetical protein